MNLNLIAPTLLRVRATYRGCHVPQYTSIQPTVSRSAITTSAFLFNRWTRNSLRKLRKANLEALAQEQQLPSKGTKEELVARLLGWQGSASQRSAQDKARNATKHVIVATDPSIVGPNSATSTTTTVSKKEESPGTVEGSPIDDSEDFLADSLSHSSVNATARVSDKADDALVEPTVDTPATIVTPDVDEDATDIPTYASDQPSEQAIEKSNIVKMMADYVDEQLPEKDIGTVDINYEESQTDETLMPENWIKAFELKVHNRGHKPSGNKAKMTFGARPTRPTRPMQPIVSNNRSPPTPVTAEDTPTIVPEPVSEPDFDAEFDRQWVNAFDKKVAQRGSRRILELKSQDIGSEIAETLEENLSSPNMANLAAACSGENLTTTQSIRGTPESDLKTFLRNIWETPISELSTPLRQKFQSTGDQNSSQENQGGDDHKSNQRDLPPGNDFAAAALGATTLVWLIGGEDGVSRTYSKLKAARQRNHTESL